MFCQPAADTIYNGVSDSDDAASPANVYFEELMKRYEMSIQKESRFINEIAYPSAIAGNSNLFEIRCGLSAAMGFLPAVKIINTSALNVEAAKICFTEFAWSSFIYHMYHSVSDYFFNGEDCDDYDDEGKRKLSIEFEGGYKIEDCRLMGRKLIKLSCNDLTLYLGLNTYNYVLDVEFLISYRLTLLHNLNFPDVYNNFLKTICTVTNASGGEVSNISIIDHYCNASVKTEHMYCMQEVYLYARDKLNEDINKLRRC